MQAHAKPETRLQLQLRGYRLTTAEILYQYCPTIPPCCKALSGRIWTSPRIIPSCTVSSVSGTAASKPMAGAGCASPQSA